MHDGTKERSEHGNLGTELNGDDGERVTIVNWWNLLRLFTMSSAACIITTHTHAYEKRQRRTQS